MSEIISTSSLRSKLGYLPAGTVSLTLIILFIFASQEMLYSEQALAPLGFSPEKFFASIGDSILRVEYLNLFSYAFVHENVMHVALNMIGLVYFGTMIERLSGASRVLIVFIAAALVSALIFGLVHYFLLNQPHIALIGASGSIAAFVGVAAYLRQFIPVLFWLIAEAAMLGASFFMSEPVSYIAHIGGFAAGLVLARLLVPMKKSVSDLEQKITV